MTFDPDTAERLIAEVAEKRKTCRRSMAEATAYRDAGSALAEYLDDHAPALCAELRALRELEDLVRDAECISSSQWRALDALDSLRKAPQS
jgi:hypothetical protein